MRDRIDELDTLRAFAFLAVVLQHSLGIFSRREDLLLSDAILIGMLFNLSKFAVPTFVFVTGIVLFLNYFEKFRYQSFFYKRIKDILIPYVLWSFIYLLYYEGTPVLNIEWGVEYVRTIIKGDAAYHLWYVVMISQVYLFFPLLLFMLKKFHPFILDRKILRVSVVGVGVLYLTLMWFSSVGIPEYQFHFENSYLQSFLIDYRGRNFLYYIYYLLIGGLIGLMVVQWRTFVSRSLIWNIPLFLILFFWVSAELFLSLEHQSFINLNYSTSLKPSMFLFTISEMMLLYVFSVIVTQRTIWSSILKFVSTYSYGGYLMHALVLTYVVRFVEITLEWGTNFLSSVICFFLASFVSIGLTLMISYIPGGHFLTGYNPRRLKKVT